MTSFFRSSDRSSSIAGDALYTPADKRHVGDQEKEIAGGRKLYLTGGREGAIDIEQDQFVDGPVGEGLGDHSGWENESSK